MARSSPVNGLRSVPERPLPPRPMKPYLDLADVARRTVVVVLVSVLLLTVAYVCWRGIHVLLQAFAGVLFALFLTTLSDWLSRHTKLSYRMSLGAMVLALVLVAAGIGWLLADRLAAQTAELTEQLPRSFEQIRNYLAQYPWGQMLLEHVPRAATRTLTEASGFSRMTGLIAGVASFLVTVVVVLVVGIFGAEDPQLYRNGLLHLLPPPYRDRAGEALDAIVFNLRWWLVGQVVLMAAIWLTTTLGLWLLGVPLALTLGLIAGLLEMIPYIGPWLSAVPAALMALLVGPWTLLLTLGLFLLLHLLEGYVLVPLIQKRVVLMPPALTLVMQVLLGDLLGLMGLFVAAPLTVVIVVLLKMLYVEDTLGDQEVIVPGEPGTEQASDTGHA